MTVTNKTMRSKEEIQRDYEDALMRLVMHEEVELEGQRILKEKEELDPSDLPTEAGFRKFEQQLDAYFKQQQRQNRKKRASSVIRKITAVIAVGIAVFLTAMTTVQAFRVRLSNLWLDVKPEYTTFRLKDSSANNGGNSLVINWTNAYTPTFIPDGYEVSAMSIGQLHREISYVSDASYIYYTELDKSSGSTIDTENADHVETVDINGHEGALVVKNEWVTVMWAMDERLFRIRVQTDIDTAIKIAEGVRYVK